MLTVLEPVAVGAAIGVVLGLLGAGGAIVAVPAFLYLFGFSPLAATTASLVVVAAAAASGAVPRVRRGEVAGRPALAFWLIGSLGTLLGSRLAPLLPSLALEVGFAVLLAVVSLAMWRRSGTAEPPARAQGRWVLPALAVGIGLMTGVFGIGGGFLIVPALVLVFALPFPVATGTSLVVIALNSITALAFKFDPDVDWSIPLLVTAGAITGAVVASRWSHRAPRRTLEQVFAVVLLLLAGWMVVRALVWS